MTARQCVMDAIRSGKALSVQDIADLCDVSRQRVHEILRQEDLRAPIDGRSVRQWAPLRTQEVVEREAASIRQPARTGGIKQGTQITGTISEMLVCADLLARGFYPFRPVVRNRSIYDVLAVRKHDALVLRIEVKTGNRSGSDLVYRRSSLNKIRNAAGEPDHYAVVARGDPVKYIPDLPE